MPSQKGGRGVFFKGHGAFPKTWSGISLCKSGRVYPCKIGQTLSFAKMVGYFSKRWAGRPLNTLVGHFSCKKLGRGGFSPCAPRCLPRNIWASKVGPRELKFGGRYVRRVPNIRIF
ncbi:hypothetical protein Pyn_32328 [Prunus yedoensis var. nudiflora]|uniref:Uncharacterized protein n=1 Tax=Prunus yedoensis var. nudiflora TaxID=2094558 RepID=A0A314YZF9_PRUYE|nr:hypothetical protein Pyn_32328 [Prunus yedoensis var. nudiflora]